MEKVVIIILVAAALGYVIYTYGGAIKGLFFKSKTGKVKLACGHCVGCPSSKECSSVKKK